MRTTVRRLNDIGGAAAAQPALVFASDWSTDTGDGDTAVRDGGKWDAWGGQPELRRVRAVTGFPTANAFSVDFDGPHRGASVRHEVTTDVPEIGGSVWWRIYARFNYDGSAGLFSNQHWFHRPPFTGAIPWTWIWNATAPSDPYVECEFNYTEVINPPNFADGEWKLNNTILKGTVYRFELEIRRVSSTNFRAYPRVYVGDSTTGPWDENNFVNHLGETMAERAVEPLMPHNEDYSHLMLTQNAMSIAPVASNAIDYAAMAKSMVGWIGPYVPGEGV